MQLGFSPAQEAFRAEVATWLEQQLSGPFAHLRFHEEITGKIAERKLWEQALYEGRWSCISWPQQFGGRNATLPEQAVAAIATAFQKRQPAKQQGAGSSAAAAATRARLPRAPRRCPGRGRSG